MDSAEHGTTADVRAIVGHTPHVGDPEPLPDRALDVALKVRDHDSPAVINLPAVVQQARRLPDHEDHLVVAGSHGRAVKRAAAAAGTRKGSVGDDLTATIGNTGTAHAGLLLADALDRAEADQLIAVVSLADGADAVIWRTTGALASRRARLSVASQAASGGRVSYSAFLTWRGFLDREPPRRPDPVAPAAPPSLRSEDWKFGFTGSACDACGEIHLPPARVCANCGVVDRMTPVRVADRAATVVTFTVDRLAYTPSPPLVAAVLDFDGGGRFRCALTDVDAAGVQIGDRVEMTFRRVDTAHGVHNYFWKARPLR